MSNVDKLAMSIYNAMIKIVLDEIDETYYDEVKKSYYRMLLNKYKELEISDEKYAGVYQRFLELEEKKWKSLSKVDKLRLLVLDNCLEEIIDISNSGFKYALDRINSDVTISKKVSDEKILEMNGLLPNVLEFNQEIANYFVSEGSLDYLYASKESDDFSFRLSNREK